MQIYRTEHPNPQWERESWRSLNGEWEFDFDFGKSAKDRELWKAGSLPRKINVPFCPESKLSGIGYTDFMTSVCYRRVFVLSKEECEKNVFLHFGAVDYESHIFINGKWVFYHAGGYSSFSCDITALVHEGENTVFVIAEDDVKSGRQTTGKQSERYNSYECRYTRTTGIWQTVWLEFVPKAYIKSAKYYPDIENSCLKITGYAEGSGKIQATASFDGKKAGKTEKEVKTGFFSMKIELDELHLWEIGKGGLYDLTFSFGEDNVKSYFGMREVRLDGRKFMLNGKTVFQRMVLDQGFYPDGIYTAKTDEELMRDIVLSMAAGFNGARLHEKIFEPRFLYYCDRLGYMVWGEHANWGMNYTDPLAAEDFINEWVDTLDRDFNHPSIIGWCPFNETWGYIEKNSPHRIIETVYKLTKRLDPTRLCIDVSGNYHIPGVDIWDIHDYEGNVEKFREAYAHIGEGRLPREGGWHPGKEFEPDNGEAIFVSEYGGLAWRTDGDNVGWGYGNDPKSVEEFVERYKGVTDVLLDNPDIMGFCYTQLYDVEQERNGLYTYERAPKFDMEIFKKINTRKAAIEE